METENGIAEREFEKRQDCNEICITNYVSSFGITVYVVMESLSSVADSLSNDYDIVPVDGNNTENGTVIRFRKSVHDYTMWKNGMGIELVSPVSEDAFTYNQSDWRCYRREDMHSGIKLRSCPRCGSDNTRAITDRSRSVGRFRCLDCNYIWGPWKSEPCQSQTKNTLYVNLYGAPGSGKSTGASWLFANLKMNGVDCEYVQEFAKDAVWEERRMLFDDPDFQFVIAAKQFQRLNRLYGKVDVVITDSPLMMSVMYAKNSILDCDSYRDVITRLCSKFNSINYFIERVKPYNPNGRNQTEDEAKQLAIRMKDFMTGTGLEYSIQNGNLEGYSKIYDDILIAKGISKPEGTLNCMVGRNKSSIMLD